MRAKIVTIQFRVNADIVAQEQSCVQREAGIYSDIDFISALDRSVDWANPENILKDYQGLILGGSGEFDFDGNRAETDPARKASYEFLERLEPLFAYIFQHDIPTLGICYGHQLLGAFAGAEVRYDEKQRKNCSHELTLLVDRKDHFLFSSLPESFQAHYGHKDALDRVPEGALLLMEGGDRCRISALKYRNNIYTTQFHPELNFEDMVFRMKNSVGYLPEGAVAEDIFKDDKHSNTILQNFSQFVALQKKKQKRDTAQ